MKPGKVGFTESPMDPIAQSIPHPLPKLLLQPDTRSPDLSYQVLGLSVTRNTIIQEANVHLEKHPSNQMLMTGPQERKKKSKDNIFYPWHITSTHGNEIILVFK